MQETLDAVDVSIICAPGGDQGQRGTKTPDTQAEATRARGGGWQVPLSTKTRGSAGRGSQKRVLEHHLLAKERNASYFSPG